jgi:short-subunit dehydrogenase
VTCLCPGPTETGFFARGSISASTTIKRVMMSSESVARIGFRALVKQKPLVIAGFRNQFLIFIERFTPRNWVTKIARLMVE